MEPGIEQPERKEENKEGRFLLESGMKFYKYLDSICPQYFGMFKSFTASQVFALVRFPRKRFAKNNSQMGDKVSLNRKTENYRASISF